MFCFSVAAQAEPQNAIFDHLVDVLQAGTKLSYRIYEKGLRQDSTRLTQEIRVNMDGMANSLLKPDSYNCFLVKIRVILWFAKQSP